MRVNRSPREHSQLGYIAVMQVSLYHVCQVLTIFLPLFPTFCVLLLLNWLLVLPLVWFLIGPLSFSMLIWLLGMLTMHSLLLIVLLYAFHGCKVLWCHYSIASSVNCSIIICILMGSCSMLHWEVIAHQGSCNTPGELRITFKAQKLPLI